jgi:hypothetical protein
MRWQAPSERTQMILLSPVLIVCVPPLFLAFGMLWCWQKIYCRLAPSSDWHHWFAWRPVQHYNGVDWFWLEHIERRWDGFDIGCIYRDAQAGVTRTGGAGLTGSVAKP